MLPAPALTTARPTASSSVLGADQREVLTLRTPTLLVRGAPGSGKTTVALALVRDHLDAGRDPGRVLLLAPTRRAAARLRDELATGVVRTTGGPLVRTASSLAFSVLRARAAQLGEPAPVLITGPEQDHVLAELLAGHAEGDGAHVAWPADVVPALRLRAFRDELRDLLMRAAERGLGPDELAALGARHHRPVWAAAAAVYREYLDVTRLRSATPDAGRRFDPAAVVDEAAEALAAWRTELPGTQEPAWDLVVVDDYQEATAATARLLHVLAGAGTRLVLLADPDAAVQTFRGASPALVERATAPAGSELGAFGADERTLAAVRRHGAGLRRVVRAVTAEIRGPVRGHRTAEAEAAGAGADVPGRARAGAPAEVALLRSSAQEAAYVAYRLRSAHLRDGVPWGRMAVVVRSGSRLVELRRALLGAQVPVEVVGRDLPLRAEPAVRPMLVALRCSVEPTALDAEAAAALLTSPLGGLDAVGLRRLRRALRAEELAGGGGRASDDLLAEVLAAPERAQTLPAAVRGPVARVARVLESGRAALERPGATTLDALWALWSTAGLAETWRRSALAGGPGGARADRDLDAVLALFTAAEQFVDRLPQASVLAFADHLDAQDLPGDSLAAHGHGEAVTLVTAAGAAGGEWDVVVVAGVQEGTWPDLRLRDSVLGAQALVDALAGRPVPRAGRDAADVVEARVAVLDDELRAFAVAVSRARRSLVVTAVSDTEQRPSPFVDLVEPGPADDGPDPRVLHVPASLDLRGVVARCRAELERDGGGADHPAARLLARLAAEGVSGASPDEWYGMRPTSTDAPLWAPDEVVPLSPSKLELASTCALRWALEAAGGTPADTGEQSLGTLVHEIAAALPDGTRDELAAALEERWPRLGLGTGWVAESRRRRADAMIDLLAAYLRRADGAVAVEAPFTVDVGRVRLRGTVDRLEATTDPEGRTLLRVVDLKTGRSAVSKVQAERHPQLGAYQLAVEAGAFAPDAPEGASSVASAGAALVYVGTGTRTPTTRDQPALSSDADPRWAEDLVDGVARTVSDAVLRATRNDLCRRCPVRRSCPAQPEGGVVGAWENRSGDDAGARADGEA
ncbi:ATP-dependent helicase [Cellulomonas sp. APG4]|uniref:ATP-dependent helicase n=1 Tax=Cellulomonas sp. APG4 TaxID=1538656 RepID=UPI00351BB367